ncbi:leucine-rich repeat-containing G-protein coupled receptor 5-like isoform X4 [Anthonomus grandis grandis]|uniref:leucine-rich repeat-containing G-protein coupled receptor 5-like isoform X4 n=1 Tax=Anthonomus grandis grandis TaxID=2921223 RepID=UPI002164FB15|nr:leucine-rich repeat-containing G-protein coupled receptor 5-like isoform X4 [Anthonomus grandis grandis]
MILASLLILIITNGSLSSKCQIKHHESKWNISCSNTSFEDSLYYIYDAVYRPEISLRQIDQLQITQYKISTLEVPPITDKVTVVKLSINFCEVENFTSESFNDINVKILNLAFNKIKNVTELLIGGLEELDLSHNSIETIDFAMFKMNLKVLNLSFNKLTELVFMIEPGYFPVSENLDLSHNRLSKIDFYLPFASISTINLQYNQLKEVKYALDNSISITKSFELSNSIINDSLLGNLISQVSTGGVFNVSNCSLQAIPNIHIFENDLILDFSHNKIRHLNNNTLRFNTIKELNLAYNEILKLNRTFFGEFYEMMTLNLSHNNKLQLEDYNFNFSGMLRILDLSHCDLKHLPDYVFNGIIGLRTLNLENNLLANLSTNTFKFLPEIETIKLIYNKLTILPEGVFQSLPARFIDVSHNELTKIEPKAFNTLLNPLEIYIENNRRGLEIVNEAFFNLSDIGRVSLRNSNLLRFTLKSFNKVGKFRHLDIKNNDFSQIKFNKKIHLKQLDISINNGSIPSKAFVGLGTLLTLTIWNSHISSMNKKAFQGLYDLTNLTLINTHIDNLEYGALDGLFLLKSFDAKVMFSGKAALKADTFKDLYTMQTLDLSDLNLTTIEPNTFTGLSRLLSLNMSNCNISVVNPAAFDGLIETVSLDLSFNAIKSLKVKQLIGLNNLKTLNLSHNEITDIEIGALQYFPTLEKLNLSFNNLTEFKVGTFSNLKSLQRLDLQRNSISNLLFETFFPLESLVTINLEFNNLKTIGHLPLVSNLKLLKQIKIAKNKWKCEFLGDMLITLKKYRIDYSSDNVNYNDDNINGIDCIDVCKYLLCLKDSHGIN